MGTDKKILAKGIKYLGWAFPLFFIGPVVIHSSFKNEGNPFFYAVLSFGILACFSAMLLMFLGIRTVMRSLFDKK
ncbi:MAG: hypothetical protein EOO45_09520 [Flavobacterium sp.]|nr:MAG: hypothetical protein EOO45_09520 [Flavobacterium sp.]